MTHLSTDQLLKIQWLLHDCGNQVHQMTNEQLQVFEKGRDDYVTNVDRALDRRLTSTFSTLFPQDGVITEENVQSRQEFFSNYQRLWLIDPLDGTDAFIQGGSHYAIMVGLLEANQPVAGWIYAPALSQGYYGSAERGLFQSVEPPFGSVNPPRSSQPLAVKEPEPPSLQFCPILIGYKDRQRYGELIADLIPGVQFSNIGSFGLKVMQVVTGRAGLYVYLNRRVKLWDTVGPVALAKAAGLVCCDLDGEPLRFTLDVLNPETLAHSQPIVIGWPRYVELLRSRLQWAVALKDGMRSQLK
ncbi:inositol monophosphatase family protein [Oculatella sp. LEGE 06141]|uniref:3'(2'),5'-bisphosphate nucleotidase CysQ family protein n=1 Tax=Oculatella sp. LEGE 06141 TaxID=1828648 RepID=UPI001881A2D5|nr:inositol monophosphatase family protein [Oculatella sp. LEGE 06141]MBE9177850.1 inositol monophosphatase family protein [Oculatella sp. LEGE 06141]